MAICKQKIIDPMLLTLKNQLNVWDPDCPNLVSLCTFSNKLGWKNFHEKISLLNLTLIGQGHPRSSNTLPSLGCLLRFRRAACNSIVVAYLENASFQKFK